MKYFFQVIIVAFILVSFASVVCAGNYDDAVEAYMTGDFKRAHQLFLTEANLGDSTSQYILGYFYFSGEEVPQDYKEAVKWYRLAADQGEVQAQYYLGHMYDVGLEVPQDYKEAAKWYRLAAEQGEVRAQSKLGVMYVEGNGVLHDNVNAYAWWAVASANGDETAKDNIKIAEGKWGSDVITNGQQVAQEILARLGN